MSKEGNAPGQDGAAGDAAAKDAIFEERGPKKIIRIVTVMAYMFSVSFVAIVLSAYYLFLWEPPNPRLLHRTSHLRGINPHYQYLIEAPPNLRRLSRHHQVEEIKHKLIELEDELDTAAGNERKKPEVDEEIKIQGPFIDDEKFVEANSANLSKIDKSLASLGSTLLDVLLQRRRNNGSELTKHFTIGNDHSGIVTSSDILGNGDTTNQIDIENDDRNGNWIFKSDRNSIIDENDEISNSFTSDSTSSFDHSASTTENYDDTNVNETRPSLDLDHLAHVFKRKNVTSGVKESLFLGNIVLRKMEQENRTTDEKLKFEFDGQGYSKDGTTKKLVNFKETQIEKMTTKSTTTTMADDNLQRSELSEISNSDNSTTTTGTYKGLLRILTETVENENISSSSSIFSSSTSSPTVFGTDIVTITASSKENETRN